MTALLDALESVGAASAYALWLPLLAWTLVWAAAEGGLWACRGAHPAVRYRVTQAVLLTLPIGLAVAALVDLSALLPRGAPALLFVPDFSPPPVSAEAPAFVAGEGGAPTRTITLWAALGFTTCMAAFVATIRLYWLGTHALAIRRLRRTLPAVRVPGLESEVQAVASRLGVRRPVEVVATEAEVVPMTFGSWRPLVVLPATLAPEDRRLALAHELVHVRHHDYAAQWLENLVAAVFAIHPAVHRLHRRCDLLREMTCDAALLAAPDVSRHSYASLVYAFVVPPAPVRPVTVGMADSTSHVNQRLRAMQTYRPTPDFSPHRAGWLLAAVVLLCGSLSLAAAQAIAQPAPTIIIRSADGSAATPLLVVDGEVFEGHLRDIDPTEIHSVNVLKGEAAVAQYGEAGARGVIRITTQAGMPAGEEGSAADPNLFVIVEQMPEPIGGIEGVQRRVRYPELARRAGIEGTAFVQFIVNEDGTVSSADCVRNPGAGLCEAAIAAVRETGFVPGLQRGRPARVRMSLPLQFRLEGGGAADEAAAPRGVLLAFQKDGENPLLVVDDEISEGHLRDLAPSDIHSIDVLKGEAAVAQYGEAGARGVVRITTRTAASAAGEISAAEGPSLQALPAAEDALEFAIHSAYPNPSTGDVSVTFTLPSAAEVQLDVFDVAGRRVHGVQPARTAAGTQQSLRIDGAGLAAGTYTYRLQARAADQTYVGSGTFTIVR